jgi:glutaminyl-peptide cyclotransferase
MRFYLIIVALALAFSCKTDTPVNKPKVTTTPTASKTPNGPVPVYDYEIVNTYKHDQKAFTQGLVFYDGFLYESTGQFGESTLRKVELETGKVLQKFDLTRDIFGEGMTILNGKAYQISWQNGLAWSYNLEDFKLLKEFRYQGEGWGLTNDGTNLIMSDGTHVIRFINPENFETISTIPVFQENGQPLMKINELEWVNGEIWANIWHSEQINLPNRIARIDPKSGKLLGWINLNGISPEDVERGEENTLNGIAYDAKTDRIFVTGKLWKRLFEIKLKAKS